MKEKMAILKVSEIVKDETLYPRIFQKWQKAYEYSEALKQMEADGNKEEFPPIVVAKISGKYVLIDGWHRLEAYKLAKKNYIKAIITDVKGQKNLYLLAVKLNAKHGIPFSVTDKTKIITDMDKLGFSREEISGVLRIKVDKMELIVEKKVRYGPNNETIILKTPISHLSESDMTPAILEQQKSLTGRTQMQLLGQMKTMLVNRWFELEKKQVVKELKSVKKMIHEILKE